MYFKKYLVPIDKVFYKVNQLLSLIAGIICGLMVIAIVSDIVGRYFFNNPIHGVTEFITYSVPVVLALGMAYGHYTNSHPAMVLIFDRLKGHWHTLASCIISLFSGIVIGMLGFFTGREALFSLSVREMEFGIVNIPIYPFKIGMSLAVLLLAFSYLLQFLRFGRHAQLSHGDSEHGS